jgi:hypothetical protein
MAALGVSVRRGTRRIGAPRAAMGSVAVAIPEQDIDHPVERGVTLLGFVGGEAASHLVLDATEHVREQTVIPHRDHCGPPDVGGAHVPPAPRNDGHRVWLLQARQKPPPAPMSLSLSSTRACSARACPHIDLRQ